MAVDTTHIYSKFLKIVEGHYEPSNALPFYIRECGGGWACIESRHKDWRFYYLTINTRLTEPEVILQWSLNPQVCIQVIVFCLKIFVF